MPLPTTPTDNWMQGMDIPSRLFGDRRSDYELYEEDGEFSLSVELPGFDREEIDLAWEEGILNVAAEHVDEDRGRQKTYSSR
jgi:HSP20 family protein